MAKHRNRTKYEQDDEEFEEREARRPAKRRGSWKFWLVSRLLVVAILLVGLAFLAPILIGSTGLWKTIVTAAAPQLAGKVDASSLKLSWIAPIEIRDLVVRDKDGQNVAQVARIGSRKTLLEIVLNLRDVGTFDVESPNAKIVLSERGSNVEDLLAGLPKSEGKGGEPPQFGLALSRGVVQLDDQVAGRQWMLDGIALDVAWTAGALAKTGKFSAAVKPVGNAASANAGQVAADFSWQPPAVQAGADKTLALGAGQVQVTLQSVPTEILQGALKRFAGDIRPEGPVTVQAAYVWGEDGKTQRAVLSSLTTPGLSVTAPALLGTDRPTLAIASGQADVQVSGSQVSVKDLKLASNLVQLAGNGDSPLAALATAASATPVSAPAGGNIELSGEIDLAELARLLPGTLSLRAGTQITSGKVQFALAGRDDPRGRGWEAELKTANLAAASGGRPVRFDQPLEVNVLIRQAKSGIEIERLQGTASFLELEGSGSLAKGSINARANLDQLVKELNQIVDFGSTRLAGVLEGKLQWSQGAAERWSATAEALAKNFEITAQGLTPWKEPNLHLTAQTQGVVQNETLVQIDSAKASVEAGADRLDVELTEVVKSPGAAATWPVKFSLRGDLASWAPRLQPVVPLGGWKIAGAIDAAGTGRFSQKASELAQTAVQLNDLAVDGPGVSIREHLVKVETGGAWDQAANAFTLASTTFASSSVAFRADGVRVVTAPQVSAVGMIDFRGDLAKLSAWCAGGDAPPGLEFGGMAAGRVEVGYRGQSLAAAWTVEVDQFACLAAPAAQTGPRTALAATRLPQSAEPIWEEPKISFAGQGTYDPATRSLKIERTSLTSANAGVSATGSINKMATAPEVDLSGEIGYSLEALTQQLQALAQRRAPAGRRGLPMGLDTLQLAGKEQRQFVLKGPLFAVANKLTASDGQRNREADASRSPSTTSAGLHISEALAGDASLSWQGAQYVGLVAGPAEFRARLGGGVVQIGPVNIAVNDGKLTTAPRLMLNGPTPSLVIDRGPLIQNVRISPEMCSLWLKFVAPMVAEATRAEGTFSLALEGAAVPLTAPATGDVVGTLAIQQAQIGPGPAVQPILATAQKLRALIDPSEGAHDLSQGWLMLPQQNVAFEVRQGAVYHRGLTFHVRDVSITTEGSVGIETQELNLVAEIPFQDSWIKNQRFALFKGKTIRIPIGGTLTRPRIDGRIVEDLGRQLVGSALQNALEKPLERGQGVLQRELGKGLEKLFGPKQE